MKITIGSLIRKELDNPDSEMSKCVRVFKAYSYLAKHTPDECRIVWPIGASTRVHYQSKINKEWQDEWFGSYKTIGYLLGFYD